MSYLLDTNAFIQAKNFYYGLDFCPAFWQWLIRQCAAGSVLSIDKVADEIVAGNDELVKWVKDDGNRLFRKTDASVSAVFPKVAAWVDGQNYEPAAVHTFLKGADFFLIAHALVHSHIVVTHETHNDSRRKIKIPNVCMGLKLPFMNTYEMLREAKARFILMVPDR